MHIETLFSTPVWIEHLNLDNKRLAEKVYNIESNHKSAEVSNRGGYQSPIELEDEELIQGIKAHTPTRKDKPIGVDDIGLFNWININRKGHYNSRHTHVDSNIFLSGVYYIKVPEDSGRIRLYDPRGVLFQSMTDHVYFNDGHEFNYINIEDGMIIYFPSWLEHDVEASDTNEDRISVAFNLFVDRDKIRGMNPLDYLK